MLYTAPYMFCRKGNIIMDEINKLHGSDVSLAGKRYQERFRIALKAAKICVFEVDLTKQLYTFFENSEDIFGVHGDDILRDVQPFSQLSAEDYQKAASNYFTHPDDADVIARAFECILRGTSTTYHARMRARDSRFIWCKVDVTPIVENGIPVRMVGVITDISDIKAKTEILEQRAKIDPFTGLYHKKYCERLIRETLEKKMAQNHALICIDMDNLKQINDTQGHAVGDLALKSMVENLKSAFRTSDIIGRFGGDEFIVLVKNISSITWLESRLAQLLCENQKNQISASAGIAFYPQDAQNYEDLFQKADKALYYSKKTKGMYTKFSDL